MERGGVRYTETSRDRERWSKIYRDYQRQRGGVRYTETSRDGERWSKIYRD